MELSGDMKTLLVFSTIAFILYLVLFVASVQKVKSAKQLGDELDKVNAEIRQTNLAIFKKLAEK